MNNSSVARGGRFEKVWGLNKQGFSDSNENIAKVGWWFFSRLIASLDHRSNGLLIVCSVP